MGRRGNGATRLIWLALVGEVLLAVQFAADVAEHALDQGHHVFQVGVGRVQLHQRELGVVPGADALVAEDAPDLVDLLQAADDQALEIQFQRDTQVQFQVERVVVGQEGPRRRAAGDRLQHRRLHLQIVLPVQILAHGAHDLDAVDQPLARLFVDVQIHIALAVAQFRVFERARTASPRPPRSCTSCRTAWGAGPWPAGRTRGRGRSLRRSWS